MEFFKSKYINKLESKYGAEIFYHSLFGNVRQIDENTKLLLDFFEEGNSLEHFMKEFKIDESERHVIDDIIQDFVEARFLLKKGEDDRAILEMDNANFLELAKKEFPFEFIGFSVTDRCNFACSYCIAGANKCKTSFFDFNKSRLQEYIFKFADELLANGKRKMGIGFTGGEPLLYWNELKEVISNTHVKYSNKLEIQIAVNTNVSLMTEDIANFFAEYNIRPSTSLDGLKSWNDKVRIYKNGKGTFDNIINGISILRNKGVSCESFYLTLTKDNFNFSIEELIEFAKDNGFRSITIEPDLVNVLEIDVDDICTKLIECCRMGQTQGVDIVGFWKRPFNNMTDYTSSTNGFCRALDFKSIVVDENGYVKPCGYSELKIAQISKYQDLVKDERYIEFISKNLRGNIDKCKGCRIEGICKGGCLISREIGQSNDDVFKYRCALYLKMTELLLQEAQFEG